MNEQHHSHSRDGILDIARELWEEQGDEFSQEGFLAETGVPLAVIDQLFGSWSGLLREAGETPGSGRWADKPEDRELVAELRQLAAVRGNNITQEQFAKHAGVSVSLIYRRFGSWRNLRAAAGLWRKAMPAKLYTNRELLDDMLRVHLKYKVKHTYWTHASIAGDHSAKAIRRRFGSWTLAMDTFEYYKREYFLGIDPKWTPEEHEKFFIPNIDHKVIWPPDKEGLDWTLNVGWHPVNDPRKKHER